MADNKPKVEAGGAAKKQRPPQRRTGFGASTTFKAPTAGLERVVFDASTAYTAAVFATNTEALA